MWQGVQRFFADAGRWVNEHQVEIEAFVTWGVVGTAGREAGLYVPLDVAAWREIAALKDRASRPPDFDVEAQILTLYGPGGLGYETLTEELRTSVVLADRRSEVSEVLSSMEDGRFYVAVCGTLPLVEYALSVATGKWRDPIKHVEKLEQRLDDSLASEIQAELLVELTALEMVQTQIPEIWKSDRHRLGTVTDHLNRNWVMHGTARGWDGQANATRAVLLLAAAAKVSRSAPN